jgi:CheY-like chemotaxis protein
MLGHTTEAVMNGRDALLMLEAPPDNRPFDFVLMDIQVRCSAL